MRHFPAADAAMCERIVRGISEKATLRPWPLTLRCVSLRETAGSKLRPVAGFIPEPRPWEMPVCTGATRREAIVDRSRELMGLTDLQGIVGGDRFTSGPRWGGSATGED